MKWTTYFCGLLMGLVATGCVGVLTPANKERLAQAEDAYAQGEDGEVVNLTSELLQRQGLGHGVVHARYLRGRALLRMGEGEAATEDLKQVLRRAKDPSWRATAANGLGELALAQHQPDKAMGLFKQAVKLAEPGTPPLDNVHFQMGKLYQRESKWESADLNFQRMIFTFPDSPHTPAAQRRVGARAWSVQLGLFDTQIAATQQAALLPGSYIQPIDTPDGLRFQLTDARWDTHARAMTELPALQKKFPHAKAVVVR
jgi:tetratricopeptide (TPR) repeat protein